MPIDYDPSIESLIHPERSEAVFSANAELSRVQLAVEAARLAYYKAEDRGTQFTRLQEALQRVGFSHLEHFCGAAGTQAFAALRDTDRLAMVAFRGTESDSIADIGIDVSAVPVQWGGAGLVHAGFAVAFEDVRSPIQEWLDSVGESRLALLVCGHSLGGAIATLAASVWRSVELVTIGAPLVGNNAFVASLNHARVERIVNCCDLVARTPPSSLGYEHPPGLTFVGWDGTLHRNPSITQIDLNRHLGRGEYFTRYALRPGNVPARDLADHAPINYLRAFFP